VQAVTLQSEDYIVNPGVLGPTLDIDDKIALYDNAAWGGTIGDSLIAEYREHIAFSNVVHIKFTGLAANQWYDLTANMPYAADWDFSYISASDAQGTNRMVIPKADGVMYPGQTDGSGNLSIYLGDLSNGGGGYRGIDSFTLTTTTAPAGPPPTQSPKTDTIEIGTYYIIVNPGVLGSGVTSTDNKIELYAPWNALIADSTEDIPLANVVHVKLTGLGLDPSRSYGLKANMTYPANWDYSYTSAADAVGAEKLTLSQADGEMEDVLLDGDGNISIYIGDLTTGVAGFHDIDSFTLTVGPVVESGAAVAGTVVTIQ
jgi:hypothetical protein